MAFNSIFNLFTQSSNRELSFRGNYRFNRFLSLFGEVSETNFEIILWSLYFWFKIFPSKQISRKPTFEHTRFNPPQIQHTSHKRTDFRKSWKTQNIVIFRDFDGQNYSCIHFWLFWKSSFSRFFSSILSCIFTENTIFGNREKMILSNVHCWEASKVVKNVDFPTLFNGKPHKGAHLKSCKIMIIDVQPAIISAVSIL